MPRRRSAGGLQNPHNYVRTPAIHSCPAAPCGGAASQSRGFEHGLLPSFPSSFLPFLLPSLLLLLFFLLATMADEDDLYADLYTEDIGNTSTGSAGAAQPGEGAEQDDATRGNLTSNGTGSGGGRSSFIPPAPAPAISMPSGSFIPPAPAKTGGSGGSFIPPPTSTTPAAAATLNTPPQARASSIDTAPSTNTDERRAMGSTSGSAAAAGASGSAYTSDKPILPHEMPDEG